MSELKFEVGDIVTVVSTKNTLSTGMRGKIGSTNVSYFDYAVDFFEENPDGDLSEPFMEDELVLDKNYIVTNILNDL